jgi:hypothetical protein
MAQHKASCIPAFTYLPRISELVEKVGVELIATTKRA